MTLPRERVRLIIQPLALFISLLTIITGCGGGTRGTDDGGSFRSTISGVLQDESGQGTPAATILLENTGDSATTGSDGSFELSAVVREEPLALSVRTSTGVEGSVDIGTVTEDSPTVYVVLVLDQSGNLRVRSIELTPLPPTPTPAPGFAPSPDTTPTPSPTQPSGQLQQASIQFLITTVAEANGAPFEGVGVSIGSKSGTTDSSGVATVTIKYNGGSIRINLQRGDFVGYVVLSQIPVEDAIVRVTIAIEGRSPINTRPGPVSSCSPLLPSGADDQPRRGCRLSTRVEEISRTPTD